MLKEEITSPKQFLGIIISIPLSERLTSKGSSVDIFEVPTLQIGSKVNPEIGHFKPEDLIPTIFFIGNNDILVRGFNLTLNLLGIWKMIS